MLDGLRRMTDKVWNHPANRGRRLRQLLSATLFQLRARVTRSPVRIKIGERSQLWASLDNGPSILAAYAPQPDYAEWNVWRRHLAPGDTFVDVGANVGIYSVLAHEVGAQVIAVEPHPQNVARLERNLALNGAHAEVWEVALTAEPAVIRFSGDLDARNHIVDDGGIEVRGDTFDHLIGDRTVAGMKIDVEGAERQVVSGAAKALTEGRIGLLQLEWNETAQANFGESREQVSVLLQEHGYRLYRPRLDGSLAETDASEGSDVFAGRPDRIAHLLAPVPR
jgi:FkbM family methyltransferase